MTSTQYLLNIKNFTLILLLYSAVFMNPSFAQSIQSETDRHHANWQQASEGVVIADHSDNTTSYASSGLTRKDGSKPDENTIFEIGSITKVFTAILLAEAVREKRAGFDDAVSAHLSNLEFNKDSPFHTITLSELATHTSGLPRLPADLDKGMDMENPYAHYDEHRLQNSLVSFRKNQLGEAGEHSYSNYGVGILGHVLTQIYGVSFRDLLKEKILDPLGMTSTDVPVRFAELPESTQKRIATPHLGGKAVHHWELNSLAGAGGMISSAEDLIRFGTAHWDPKTPQGLATSLAEVAKPRMEYQGLGWGIEGNVLSHGGGTGGFRTELEVDTRKNTVRVFLANSAGMANEVILEGDFSSIAGYWSGELTHDGERLRLVSSIGRSGRVVVYSIDQDNHAVLSARSQLVDDQFYFSFPSVQAVYEGHVKDRELLGTFVQGNQDRVAQILKLKHSSQMPEILRNGLKNTMQGELTSLHGYWSGYLGGKKGLFVYLKVTAIGEVAVIELHSPDQQNEPIKVSSASLIDREFEVHSQPINGKFSGKLAKDGKSIKGSWTQSQPMPLTLYFSEDTPERD